MKCDQVGQVGHGISSTKISYAGAFTVAHVVRPMPIRDNSKCMNSIHIVLPLWFVSEIVSLLEKCDQEIFDGYKEFKVSFC